MVKFTVVYVKNCCSNGRESTDFECNPGDDIMTYAENAAKYDLPKSCKHNGFEIKEIYLKENQDEIYEEKFICKTSDAKSLYIVYK